MLLRSPRSTLCPYTTLFRSHCHIAGSEFTEDLKPVVARAKSAGLAHALVILAADDATELAQAGEVSGLWPDVRFSIGVHPHAEIGKHTSELQSRLHLVCRPL